MSPAEGIDIRKHVSVGNDRGAHCRICSRQYPMMQARVSETSHISLRRRMWETSDIMATAFLRGEDLYRSLMAFKPRGLSEGEWSARSGLSRGYFTDLKMKNLRPRTDTLRKLLSVVGKTEADLHAWDNGRQEVSSLDKVPDVPRTRNASEGESVGIVSLDLSLSMGPGTLIEEFVEAQPIQFDVGILRAVTRSEYHRLRVVKGIGDSMEPTLRTGDRVLVDTTDRQLSRLDGIYWITLYGAHGIKRLKPAGRGRIMVISDNRDVSDPVEVDADDVTIEGRIIWFSRDL